ncbi:acyltransferase [Methylophilaceae bacterium]|nr:acyltransferase [Methylophilaceae bacterium]
MLSFLRKKISNIKLKNLIFLEYEQFIQFVFSFLPGNLGLLLRSFIYKFFLFNSNNVPFIQKNVVFVHSNRIIFGKNLSINSFCYINGIGDLSFGDNVLIGPSVVISSGLHTVENQNTPTILKPTVLKKITIGNDVWIGANVTIMPGVKIDDGSIIGANSVVTKSTKKFGIYVGAPARLKNYRNK